MRTVRMIDPLRHAVELIREQVEEKQLKVRLEVPELLCVQADTDMLLQIFANLLRNSAQAVPSGGSIGVRASLSPEHAQVECWDDGPGVPDHLRETIWITWGHTTTQGGSGLGLAITQRLVQKLGWRIALESRGLRTSFCMYVPSRAVRDPASLDRGEVGAGGDGAGIGHLADPLPEPRALSRRS
jgi:signal transduction histidine kinase